MTNLLNPLAWNVPIVDKSGNPTREFMIKWDRQRTILANANVQGFLDSISTTQGATLYRNANDWAALPPGTAGHFLKTNGAGADPAWAASPTIQALLDGISSTHGAVLYRGSSAWAALAPGSNGQVLTAHGASADPTWETPSGGGGGSTLTGFSLLPTADTTSGGAAAFKGHTFIPNVTASISRVGAWLTPVNGATYKAVMLALDGSNQITAVASSAAFTGTADTAFQLVMFTFNSPVALSAGTRYALMVGRTDGADNYVLPIHSSAADNPLHGMPGKPITFATPACTLADADPAVSLTVTEVSGSFGLVTHFTL